MKSPGGDFKARVLLLIAAATLPLSLAARPASLGNESEALRYYWYEVRYCNRNANDIASALERIDRAADNCSDSRQLSMLLQAFRACSRSAYEICPDETISRNVFDRTETDDGQVIMRTISWNPQLRTELEMGCDGDPGQPVYRDPTASLVHEIVHAVQDCAGLNPGEHEIEAVAIENVYRRATGLCQRSRYGDQPLPTEMWRQCTEAACEAVTPLEPFVLDLRQAALPLADAPVQSGDQPR